VDQQWRTYHPYHSPLDPCPPRPKSYVVPPNQYITYQVKGMKQFAPREALKRGTLWPDLYSPYDPPHRGGTAR
jgi:spore coat protein JA